MQTINLILPQQSSIPFEIIQFPDGEPHIKLLADLDRKDSCLVICRICNPTDLFIVCQVADILYRHEIVWKLSIKYLMGARMDRVISFNEAFSLKIIANAINTFCPEYVSILEPHSDRTLREIYNSEDAHVDWKSIVGNNIVVLPDAGAKKRYSTNPYFTLVCKKVRNPENGQLMAFSVENPEILKNLDKDLSFWVVDDLCDGGGTFVGIVKMLRELAPNRKCNIFVTHLVNPRGLANLCENFDKVVVTNSYKNWESNDNNFKCIDVI